MANSSVTYEVIGLPELSRAIQKRTDPRIFERPLLKAIMSVPRFMLVYPPFRPGQSYIRTGDYGKEWEVSTTVRATGFEAKYENFMPYAPYAGNQEVQAEVHRFRWRTDEQAIRHIRPILEADLVDAIERA